MLGEEGAFFRRRRLGAGGTGDDGSAALLLADLRPELVERRGHVARVLALAVIGDRARQARIGFGPPRGGVRLGLDDQKSPGRAERETGMSLALPDRGIFVLEIEIAEFMEDQEILALAIMRATDQRDVALARGDARQRNPGRID